MSWLITGTQKEPPSPYILDTFPTAAAAYSLRLLRTGVTNVVRVRRSSDNTEQDFTAAQVTDGTLTTFCGAGNGFVRTWYDQSGNSHNLEQTTTANQPQIVSSGSLVTKGTRPSLDFDGSNDRLTNNTISLSQPITHLIISSRDNTSGPADAFFDSFNAIQHVFYNTGTTETVNQYYAFNAGITPVPQFAYSTSTDLLLSSILFNGASSNARINNTSQLTINAFTNGLSGISLGELRGDPNPIVGGYALDGKISEYIVYGSNQSSNISGIEANINAHYAIY